VKVARALGGSAAFFAVALVHSPKTIRFLLEKC
jgi:hypothetical protein